MRPMLRLFLYLTLIGSVAVVGGGVSLAQSAGADADKIRFHIPSQELQSALNEFALESKKDVLFSPDIATAKRSNALDGEYDTNTALKILLLGTGLVFREADARTILIDVAARTLQENEQSSGTEPASRNGFQLEEVIVTAQKREEKLIDVPVAISALSGEQLDSLRVKTLTDLAGYVPGLSIVDQGAPGNRTIIMRGLATSAFNPNSPTVAVYVDDSPVGNSANHPPGGDVGIDLNPYDLERIEVLNGPQGTLYGADALGGVIKYVLHKPDLNNFDVRAGAYVEHVDGGGTGQGVRGAVSIPLVSGALALRVSGFRLNNAGWIDNIANGVRDANSSSEEGARVTLLWHPLDSLSIQANWLRQNVEANDVTGVTLNDTTRQVMFCPECNFSRFPEDYLHHTRITSLDVNWDLGFASLMSASSWSRVDYSQTEDWTANWGPFTPGHPNALAAEFATAPNSKFSEELRLSSKEEGRFQWMLGGFYTRESFAITLNIPTFITPSTPLPLSDALWLSGSNGVYKEWAGFGNATLKITDSLDLGGGVRYARNTETDCPYDVGGVFNPPPATPPPCVARPYQGSTTWMGTARYHLSADNMLYARVATGYRPGGTNCAPGMCLPGVPLPFYGPDRTTNYEVGLKSQALERKLQINLAAFYINWKDVQLDASAGPPSNALYIANGGKAVSKGLEGSVAYTLTSHWQFGNTVAYTDAHLTQDAPAAGGVSGEQLPGSARWTASVTTEYSHPLRDNLALLAGAAYRYRDYLVNNLRGSFYGPEPIQPQNRVDAHIGLTLGPVDTRLYGKNIFNNRSYVGYFGTNLALQNATMLVPTEPRTIGLSVDYKY